ncbi:MAG: ABC transporter permease [Planctomycetes bacterium]|nr:ABC transporter permease [Planctomycetota bacterium]
MLRALTTTWFSFRHHLYNLVRSKRFLFVLLLACVAPVMGELIATPDRPMRHLMPLSLVLTLGILAPLSGLLLGTTVLAEDIENKTLTYIFTRPIPRWSLFLGRWAACVSIALVLMGLSAWWVGHSAEGLGEGLTIKARHRVPEGFTMRFVLAAVLCTAWYTALAAGLSTFLRRATAVGLAYAFVLEMIISNLPGSTQRMSVQYHLRNILMDGEKSSFGPLRNMDLMEGQEATVRLLISIVFLLLLGTHIVRRRQYVLSS